MVANWSAVAASRNSDARERLVHRQPAIGERPQAATPAASAAPSSWESLPPASWKAGRRRRPCARPRARQRRALEHRGRGRTARAAAAAGAARARGRSRGSRAGRPPLRSRRPARSRIAAAAGVSRPASSTTGARSRKTPSSSGGRASAAGRRRRRAPATARRPRSPGRPSGRRGRPRRRRRRERVALAHLPSLGHGALGRRAADERRRAGDPGRDVRRVLGGVERADREAVVGRRGERLLGLVGRDSFPDRERTSATSSRHRSRVGASNSRPASGPPGSRCVWGRQSWPDRRTVAPGRFPPVRQATTPDRRNRSRRRCCDLRHAGSRSVVVRRPAARAVRLIPRSRRRRCARRGNGGGGPRVEVGR